VGARSRRCAGLDDPKGGGASFDEPTGNTVADAARRVQAHKIATPDRGDAHPLGRRAAKLYFHEESPVALPPVSFVLLLDATDSGANCCFYFASDLHQTQGASQDATWCERIDDAIADRPDPRPVMPSLHRCAGTCSPHT